MAGPGLIRGQTPARVECHCRFRQTDRTRLHPGSLWSVIPGLSYRTPEHGQNGFLAVRRRSTRLMRSSCNQPPNRCLAVCQSGHWRLGIEPFREFSLTRVDAQKAAAPSRLISPALSE